MFERYTERARQVIVNAQDEARRLRHSYLDTEHLLLGLLADDSSAATVVLAGLGVELTDVRGRVHRLVGGGEEVLVGQIPFTPRAKKVLELGLREALSLGHNFIGTEHILLGLVREWDVRDASVAARVLDELHLDGAAVRNAVVRFLASGSDPAPEEQPARRLIQFLDADGDPIQPRPRRRRCDGAFGLHGSTFFCQDDKGHEGDHVEHGDGWTMRWTRR